MSRGLEFASRWFRRFAQLGAVGFSLAMIFGWFSSVHTAFDSFSTFRMFFGSGLLAALLVLLLYRRWAWVLGGMAVVAVSLILTMPNLPGMKRGWAVAGAPPLEGKPTLRVAQANILWMVQDHSETAQVLLNSAPDVIVLQEVAQANRQILDLLTPTHPHILDCTPDRWHSVAIASRFPFDAEFEPSCPPPGGLGLVHIEMGEKTINIGSFHAWWPWPRSQNYQLDIYTEVLSQLRGPSLVGGDFNASPWSNAVARMAASFGGQVPSGLAMTWQPGGLVSWLPKWPLLSLDHMLHTADFGLVSREVLPSGRSDHHPVVSEYVLLN
ncbi:MAG: endonuclease/exonuclease/phosphatase family protein [Pseudomonadota bacterium]